MNEYEYLQKMKEDMGFKESAYSLEDVKREEAYLIYKGHAYKDSWTGEFIYTGPREMGS
jgi:hypothetical protein